METSAQRRLLALLLLAVLPAALASALIAGSVGHAFAIEFRGNIWIPGHAILHGESPYDVKELERVARLVRDGQPPPGFPQAVYPAYPPPTLLAGLPFALIPLGVARWIWLVLCLACPAAALRLLGCRDWRAYGAAYLSIVVISGAMLGSLTLPLLVGLAAIWRYRDDWRRCGPIAAAVVCAKLFLWPVLIWLIATRRWRAAGAAAVITGAANVIGWAALGFADLRSYPHLLSLLSSIEEGRGYSVLRAGLALGLGTTGGRLLAYAVGACLLAGCARMALRHTHRADVQAFTLALFAALALSPIVWEQYYALLFVPIALHARRFSPLWLAPLLFWLAPFNATEGHPERLAVAAAVLLLVGVTILAPRRPQPGYGVATTKPGTP